MAVTRNIPPWKCFSEDPIDFGVPPIACTCRAVRIEALKSYYKENTFTIHGSCDIGDFNACRNWIEGMIDKGYWSNMKPP